MGTPVEEIAEELSESGVTDVRQIGSKETGIYVLSFDMPTPPQHVKCAYVRLPVEEYTPNPMRCFKCQKYGHTTNKCNSQVACGRCGTNEQDHSTRECRGKPYCVNCKGEHPAFSKKCPKFLEEKEIQSLRVKRKISFTEARKIVRAAHAPTRNYAAAVSSKNSIATQTPNWPQQAVMPQLLKKAPNNQAGKSQPKQKTSTDDEGKATRPCRGPDPSGPSQGRSGSLLKVPVPSGTEPPSKGPIRPGPPKEGKSKQPSKGPTPPGPSPGRSASSSGIPVLSGTKSPPKTSGGSTKPSTSGACENSLDKAQEDRRSVPVAESSYAGKAASPPRPKPVTLRRSSPCLLTVTNRFAALSEPSMTVLRKQATKTK